VSDTWTPDLLSTPNSLVCDFQRLEFSKGIVISNVTGSSSLLLTIVNSDKSVLSVYIDKSIEDIQDVGVATWKNGATYAVTSKNMPSGRYVIGAAHLEYFGVLQQNRGYSYLVIEEIHVPTDLETFVMQNSLLAQVILAIVLTCGFSLTLLSLLGLKFEISARREKNISRNVAEPETKDSKEKEKKKGKEVLATGAKGKPVEAEKKEKKQKAKAAENQSVPE